jgi:thioredoxin 1
MALFAVPAGAQDSGAPIPAAELISGAPHSMPVAGMVTMVDIGAHSCIPCKMMTPIIEELSTEYEGRAAIAFIDVWEHREEAPKYGVTTIPTQIFYDAQGKERYRHVGFLDKQSIVAKLAELGVN